MTGKRRGRAKKREGAIDSKTIEPQARASQDVPGFPIIGIGASAGGLEAFEQFFRRMPADSGMAFVLVSHLDPGHASMLTEILQRSTSMPVIEAQDGMAVAPNRVYVIPPNRDMTLLRGALQLRIPECAHGQRMPIDVFLRSLANEQGEKAIGMILSGTGTDGTLGMRAVLGAGGVSFVQDPATAKYDGMPLSAIHSNLTTYILPAEKLPEQLLTHMKTTREHKTKLVHSALAAPASLNSIMAQLRSKTGHDFSRYKESTVRRRIERRMTAHGIADTDTYTRYLEEHPQEAQALFKELLINVTSFFRDLEAFEALKKEVLPRLFEGKPESYVFRIWVVACATGEEAYSIAMLFREYMDESRQEYRVQIYGTDIDDDAITSARSGTYPVNIALDVSPERLRRFFVKEESSFRIKKEIREMIVFAVQNVIKDPPFTKLDLVSCRNLLIYLEPELQSRIIPIFHGALNPGGVLFLSSSEGTGAHSDLFVPVNGKWKLYESTPSIDSTHPAMTAGLSWTGGSTGPRVGETMEQAKETNFAELAKRVLLQSYAPASVITDAKGNVLYAHGDAGKYLRLAPGQASLNIIEMACEGLQSELRTVINKAAMQKRPVVLNDLPVKTDGGTQGVNVTVRTVKDPGMTRGLLMISFQDAAPVTPGKPARAKRAGERGESKRVEELERELLYTKENLQASVEELQASNEEIQSTNEELQSTNEELESSAEELQSVNEELVTVNSELQTKIEQISGIQNDMKNLLDSMNIATIFLDDTLAIKLFTHNAVAIYRLVASDIGRSLGDIKSNIEGGEDLLEDARALLDSLAPREREVRTIDKRWYLARFLPYRTLDNVVDGVVLTFVDVTELKRMTEERLETQSDERLLFLARAVNYAVRDIDLVKGRVWWNDTFNALFGARPTGATDSWQWWISRIHPDDRDRIVDAIEAAMGGHDKSWTWEYRFQLADGRYIHILDHSFLFRDRNDKATRILGTMVDITARKEAEEADRAARDHAESIVDTVREPLIVLDSELHVVSANRSFCRTFSVTLEETIGNRLYDLGNRQWDIPRLRDLLENVLPQNTSFENLEVEHDFPTLGRRKILLNARRIRGKTGGTHFILLALEDITGHPLGEGRNALVNAADNQEKEQS